MVVLQQAQAQSGSDVEARVKMIDFVVEEYQKGWNGQRTDQAPTFHPLFLAIATGCLYHGITNFEMACSEVLPAAMVIWLSHQVVI